MMKFKIILVNRLDNRTYKIQKKQTLNFILFKMNNHNIKQIIKIKNLLNLFNKN